MKTDDGTPPTGENVIDMSSFRQKKATEQEFGRGRTPLYVSHLTGKVSGGKPPSGDLGERLQRIRASLEKINRLMKELKKMGSMDDFSKNDRSSSQTLQKPSPHSRKDP